MTYNEAKTIIVQNLTRVGSNRISGQEVREAVLLVLDFAAAIDTKDAIPDWSAELTFQTDGTDAGKYCKHRDTSGQLRFFETKTDDNTNNEPPTDPDETQNTSWEEISASAGSAIKEWSPGLFGDGLQIVYHTHSTLGRLFLILVEPTRPFNSTDIEAEITAGKWETVGTPLSAVLVQGNDAGATRITNLSDPVDPQDAATKSYVLAALTSVGRPRGGFDASSGDVPSPPSDIQEGDFWRITIAGTIGTMVLKPGDVLFAATDEASQASDFFGVQSNVDLATDAALGLTKLYGTTGGANTDGAPTQHAVNTAIGGIQQDQETLKIYKMSNFGSP